MSKHIMFVSAVIALIVAMTPTVLADVPQLISFQGILYDNVGNPLTGQYNVTFRIYDIETGGTHVWLETISVDCDNGLYNVILGHTNQLNLDFDGQYWLGVQVMGDNELNAMNWKDDWFDAKVLQAASTVDPAERRAFYTEAINHLISEAPRIQLPAEEVYTYWWPWVKNYFGEYEMGYLNITPALERLWIDQAMKKDLGF